MPMLGDIFLNTVYSERPERSVKATDHPVEGGENIVDHIEKKPIILDISGVVTGPDASLRLNKLEQYRKKGEPLKYVYRNWLANMIIEKFRSTHDSGVDKAFRFNITLKEVRVAKPSVVKALKLPQKVQTSSVGNKGRQQLTRQEKAVLKEMGNL